MEVDLIGADEASFDPAHYGVGEVLAGRFRIERVIGVGSMGVVLAATHLELDERVAIKFIRSEMQALPGVVQRFAREAKAAVSIKSEHIAQVFDVGMVPGVGPYIVMEYLEGRDLGEILEEEGRLPVRRAAHYILQACEALAVAHSRDITHRDMKPENLFLTRRGDQELIKLLDFGISKASLTGRVFGDELASNETACLLGTPLYMSPEQIRSTDGVDHRTDVWSLGAVLYELVTGESAFVADSVSQVWHRILETEPVPIAQHCPDAPPTLQAVLSRCLQKDVARRYQNVAELAIDLLPFAPSRARTYAQRAASILGVASDSLFPLAAHLSLAPPSGSELSGVPPSSLATVALSGGPSLPSQVAPDGGPGGRTTAARLVVLSALSLGAAGVWFGLSRPGATPQGFREAAPVPVEPVSVAEEPATVEPLESSRNVLLESEPSGALVELAGEVIGVTPLATLLPVGTREIVLEKQGYESRNLVLQLEAAPRDSKPVHTRVELEAVVEPEQEAADEGKKEQPKKPSAAKAESAEKHAPEKKPERNSAARRAARPARRASKAPAKVVAKPRAAPRPAPATATAENKEKPHSPPAPPRLLIEDERPRLLIDEDARRAKILD